MLNLQVNIKREKIGFPTAKMNLKPPEDMGGFLLEKSGLTLTPLSCSVKETELFKI